jgi:hypothetical protein
LEDQALRSRGLAAALAVAALIAGCGGDDEDSGSPAAPSATGAPPAKEPLAAAAARLERALPGRDCAELAPLMLHSAPRGADEPDTPPTKAKCAQLRNTAGAALRGFKATRSVEFGAGGVTEGSGHYPRKGEVVGLVWALDRDGSWEVVYTAVFRKQIGPKPAYGAATERNAERFVRAVADRDCPAVWRTINAGSRFAGSGSSDALCRSITPQYRKPDSAYAQIAAERGARLRQLGATRDLAFFGLGLKNGRYMVIVMSGQFADVNAKKQREHANPGVLEFVTVRRAGE